MSSVIGPSVIGPVRDQEDDRVFLKRVIAESPYWVPTVDLGLSGYAAHTTQHIEEYLPWITDNCQHCRAGLLKEIDQLLAVLQNMAFATTEVGVAVEFSKKMLRR